MQKTKILGQAQNKNLLPASVPRGDQMKVLGLGIDAEQSNRRIKLYLNLDVLHFRIAF